MTQEAKDLLLKDLSARLSHGVRIVYKCNHIHELRSTLKSGMILAADIITDEYIMTSVENVTPYLFPFSSMTKEQKEEHAALQERVVYNSKGPINVDVMKYVNWCYKHHIDINGLIPMGLALDATNKNIY